MRVEEAFGRLPLYFVENQGQVDEQVAYTIQGADKTIYFTSSGVTYALTGQQDGDLHADLQAPHLALAVRPFWVRDRTRPRRSSAGRSSWTTSAPTRAAGGRARHHLGPSERRPRCGPYGSGRAGLPRRLWPGRGRPSHRGPGRRQRGSGRRPGAVPAGTSAAASDAQQDARIHELESQFAKLQQQNAALKAQLAAPADGLTALKGQGTAGA